MTIFYSSFRKLQHYGSYIFLILFSYPFPLLLQSENVARANFTFQIISEKNNTAKLAFAQSDPTACSSSQLRAWKPAVLSAWNALSSPSARPNSLP